MISKEDFLKVCRTIFVDDYNLKHGIVPHIFKYDNDYDYNTNGYCDKEANQLYTFLSNHGLLEGDGITIVNKVLPTNEIIIVEEDSVDINTLKEQGYRVLSYNKGSAAPMFIKELK